MCRAWQLLYFVLVVLRSARAQCSVTYDRVDCTGGHRLTRLPVVVAKHHRRLVLADCALGDARATRLLSRPEVEVPSLLDLSGNSLEHLYIANNLRHLRTLILSRNSIRGYGLATTLTLLKGAKVQRVMLEDEGISRLQDHLSWPPDLQHLSLADNEISSLHSRNLASLIRLQTLSLAGNRLSSLPDQVFRQQGELRRLALDNNYVRRMNAHTLAGLAKLEELTLDGNRFEVVRHEWFRSLTNLRVLSLCSNRIKVLTAGSLSHLTIKELRLSRMDTLEAVEAGSLANLTSLKSLSVSDNQNLAYMDDEALDSRLVKLTRLDLSNNALTSLPAQLYLAAEAVETVALTGNRFRCDCTAAWIGLALGAPKSNALRRVMAALKCNEPESARGAALTAPLVDKSCRRRTLVYPRMQEVDLGDEITFTCKVLGPMGRSEGVVKGESGPEIQEGAGDTGISENTIAGGDGDGKGLSGGGGVINANAIETGGGGGGGGEGSWSKYGGGGGGGGAGGGYTSGRAGGARWRSPNGKWINGSLAPTASTAAGGYYSINGDRLTVRTSRLSDRGRYECYAEVVPGEREEGNGDRTLVGVAELRVRGGDLKLRWTARTSHSIAVTWFKQAKRDKEEDEGTPDNMEGNATKPRQPEFNRQSGVEWMRYAIKCTKLGDRENQDQIIKLSRIGY